MSLFVDDLRDYLISLDIAPEDNIFCNYRPDDPESIIVITEYDSTGTFGVYDSNVRRVQFIVREKRLTEAARKSWEVYNTLFKDKQYIIHINEDRFIIPVPLQSPFHLETDDRGRKIYVFNASITTNKDFKEEK